MHNLGCSLVLNIIFHSGAVMGNQCHWRDLAILSSWKAEIVEILAGLNFYNNIYLNEVLFKFYDLLVSSK